MTSEGLKLEKLNAEIALNAEQNAEQTEVKEYEQVNNNFRLLADIRFKLLALIPTLGGVAIFLLSGMQQEAEETLTKADYSLLLLISGLGFLATLGVTFYDQRNSELYNALISRANFLEKKLKLPPNPKVKKNWLLPYRGQFRERPGRDRRLFELIQLGHDSGLALIYGAVLGAWFYPLVSAFLGVTAFGSQSQQHAISSAIAAFMVMIFILELLRLDGTFKRQEAKVDVRRRVEDGILRETLHFRGKEIDYYEDGDSYFTLYECPNGYRVYVKNGGDRTANLNPWLSDSNGSLTYPTYNVENLVQEFPVFKEAVAVSRERYLN